MLGMFGQLLALAQAIAMAMAINLLDAFEWHELFDLVLSEDDLSAMVIGAARTTVLS